MSLSKSGVNTESVKVVARCRPLASQEAAEGRGTIVSVKPPNSLVVEPPGTSFLLDAAFGQSSTQAEVFDHIAKPIIDQVLDGYNGTIFAYGQTGSGKTYTMEGTDDQPGVMPRTFDYLSERIAALSTACDYVVYLSFLEIYNDDVTDLLIKAKAQPAKLDVKESKQHGIFVYGLGQHVVQGRDEMMRKLALGKQRRKVGETKMNQESSRSHSILTLTVIRVEGAEGNAAAAAAAIAAGPKGPKPPKAVGKVSVGKLHLVDLAGSERVSKTGAAGERLKEGIAINKSLSALGNVMSALCDGKSGALVPYRDSKLTRLLQDSLGGNSKTVMIANVGPADWNADETLSTLKYAARARNIKNAPKVNDDPADAVVQQYKEQVEKLHTEFAAKVARMEEEHSKEVQLLKQELQQMQVAKAASAQEAARLAALQQQLEEMQAEKARRQQQEQEVEVLKSQLAELQLQADQQQQLGVAAAEGSGEDKAVPVPAPAVASVAVQSTSMSAPSGTASPKRANTSTGKYHKEIMELKDRIRQMQKDAIDDYSQLLAQSDELACLRAKALSEAGRRVQADEALRGLQEQLLGVQGLSSEQAQELKRLQGMVDGLQARGVRPRGANLDVVITGDGEVQTNSLTTGGGRSLREDPGCNMLFEELVLEMGYEAEAARQAIMAMPGGTMDEIIDYILDKEALFNAWRRFKAALAL